MKRSFPAIASWLLALAVGPPVCPASAATSQGAPAAPPAPPAEQTIQVLWVDGVALLVAAREADGSQTANPVTLGADLASGRVLQLALGANLHVLVDDALLASADGPGRFVVCGDGLQALDRAAPRRRILTGYEPGLAGDTLGRRARRPPGVVEPVSVASPRGATLADPAPLLRWRAREPETRVELQLDVLGALGRLDTIERWSGLGGTEHRPWRPLERGRYYRWEILPYHAPEEERVASHAWFRVMSAEEAASLQRSLAALDGHVLPGEPPPPEIEVLRARLFESHGMAVEAAATWAGLAKRWPRRRDLRLQVQRLARLEVQPPAGVVDYPLPFGVTVPDIFGP